MFECVPLVMNRDLESCYRAQAFARYWLFKLTSSLVMHIFKVNIGAFVLREDLAATTLARIAVRGAFMVCIA